MIWAIILIVAVLLILIIGSRTLKKQATKEPKRTPEFKATATELMSKNEAVLYHKLKLAFPNKLIFAQVELTQIVKITGGDYRQKWWNKANGKSIDFVICEKDMEIVGVIELDDKTHDTKRRQERDADKNAILQAAAVKLVRWRWKEIPSQAEINAAFEDKRVPRFAIESEVTEG